MVDFNQFGSYKPGDPDDPQHCAECEAMLADALDETLSPKQQATFESHMAGCPSCSAMLAEAKRGLMWLEMLHTPRPEPPPDLMARILEITSVDAERQALSAARPDIVLGTTDYIRLPQPRTPNTLLGGPMMVPSGIPGSPYVALSSLPFKTRMAYTLRSLGQTMLQPRLAMTAAMAFFSIVLTLDLTGVRVRDLRLSSFKPSSIMRSAYEAKARVVRYSDNLRVVYELESRVRDLQRSTDDDGTTPAPQNSTPPPTSPQNSPQPGQQPGTKNKQNDDQNSDPAHKQAHPGPGGSSLRQPVGDGIRVAILKHPRLGCSPEYVVEASDFVALIPSMKQEGGLV